MERGWDGIGWLEVEKKGEGRERWGGGLRI